MQAHSGFGSNPDSKSSESEGETQVGYSVFLTTEKLYGRCGMNCNLVKKK